MWGLAINGPGAVAWWNSTTDDLMTQNGVALAPGAVINSQTVNYIATVSGGAAGGLNFLDNNGDILARVEFTNGNSALVELQTVSATPEPGTWFLLFGAAVLAGLSRLRRSGAQYKTRL